MTQEDVQLRTFIDRFTPEIAARGSAIIHRLRARLPNALLLVYDNYNALAVGFAPAERASEAILSVALYPRWVSLFFLQGAALPDPAGLLRGAGNVVRHIVLASPEDLDRPAISALIEAQLAAARVKLDPHATGKLVIKSVSAKQRPRRPEKAGGDVPSPPDPPSRLEDEA
jgi:hypothetical protein